MCRKTSNLPRDLKLRVFLPSPPFPRSQRQSITIHAIVTARPNLLIPALLVQSASVLGYGNGHGYLAIAAGSRAYAELMECMRSNHPPAIALQLRRGTKESHGRILLSEMGLGEASPLTPLPYAQICSNGKKRAMEAVHDNC